VQQISLKLKSSHITLLTDGAKASRWSIGEICVRKTFKLIALPEGK
jgi:hypothetical protein